MNPIHYALRLYKLRTFQHGILAAFVIATAAASGTGEFLVVLGLAGQPGGRLVYGERSEPKTLNPIFAADTPSRAPEPPDSEHAQADAVRADTHRQPKRLATWEKQQRGEQRLAQRKPLGKARRPRPKWRSRCEAN